MAGFVIKVVWAEGDEEYLQSGPNVARFPNRRRAKEHADFMKIGMDDGECQSINVVPYTNKCRPKRRTENGK